MKIRNNTRIMSLVLALVMLLPLISIPAFAEDTPATPEYSETIDGKTLADIATVNPASAQILPATVDSANHGDVVQIDLKGMNTAPYYLWQDTNNKWPITGEVVDGKISGTANGMTVPATDVPANDDATVECVIGETTYKIVTGVYADSMGGFTNIAKTLTLKNPAFASADASLVAIALDIYLSEDFKNSSDVSGRIESSAGNVELFGITAPGGNNPKISNHENGKIVDGAAHALKKGAWNSLLFVINMNTADVFVYVDGAYAFRETNRTALNTAIDLKASKLQVQIDRTGLPSSNGGYIQIDNVAMTSDPSLVGFDGTLYSQNFDGANQTVGSAPASGTFASFGYTDAVISDDLGSKAVKVEWNNVGTASAGNDEGDLNVDKSSMPVLPALSYKEAECLVLEAKYYVKSGSVGRIQSQFNPIKYNDGTSSRNWVDLYQISFSDDIATAQGTNGEYMLLTLESAKDGSNMARMEFDCWNTVSCVIDMVDGDVNLYVNGVYAFSYNLATRFSLTDGTKFSFDANKWIVGKVNKFLGSGTFYMDDLKVYAADASDCAKYLAWQNFEGLQSGVAPSASLSVANEGTVVDTTKGSKSWKIEWNNVGGTGNSDTGDLNIDKNSSFQHAALNYTDHPVVVFSADYFIEGGSKGRIQSQLNGIYVNGAADPTNWSDLYQLKGDNGNWVLQREGGTTHGSATLLANKWNNVAAELNLVTGKLNVYLNGVLTIDSWLAMSDSAARTNMTAGANKWIVGKVNKILGSGTFYMDNFSVSVGAFKAIEAPAAQTFEDFEAFKAADGLTALGTIVSAPALATYKVVDGNTVLRLGMGAAKSEEEYCLYNATTKEAPIYGVAYTAGAEKITHSGTEYTIAYDEAKANLPYITIGEAKYYVITSAAGEAAYNGANVGTALQVFASTLSYKDSKTAILEEDLFIEEGSTGVIESQFNGFNYEGSEESGGWLQLFHLYMESGLITGQGGKNFGVSLNKGEWNNIKILVDLEAGEFYIFANGVLARTYDCGKDNITMSSAWIAAKVQRHNDAAKGAYKGGILIDNVRVSTENVPMPASQYGQAFLTDEAFEAFVADLLTSVNGASIRLSTPTGLRFASKVNTAKLNYLVNVAGAEATDQGTVIAPANYMEKAGEFTKEALDTLDVSVAYLDVKFDGVYFSGDAGFDTSDASYMVGSIVNFKDGNITREFAGAAYVELTIGDAVYTVYADAQVRSVQNVARAALEDYAAGGVEFTDAQVSILAAYAQGNQPS